MTVLEMLLQQVDRLSPEEKAALRKRLDAGCGQPVVNGAGEQPSATSLPQTGLWGLMRDDADALDEIVKSIYSAREGRPWRTS